MDQGSHGIYSVDGVQIDTSRLCVIRDGEELHVRAKTFQVLLFLLENRERLVTRNELVDAVWPDTAVTDNALEQCLGEIRKLFGDDARHPRLVKTVRGQGYRFIGEVDQKPARTGTPDETQRLGSGSTRQLAFIKYRGLGVAAGALLLIGSVLAGFYIVRGLRDRGNAVNVTIAKDPARRTVAIMFFDNQSNSDDLDWLREGLADMMITDLSRSQNLAVLSREQLHTLLTRIGRNDAKKLSLEEALSIAHTAQANVLVLGSFVKLGDQIRIDVHLHDAVDGQLLTAERVVVDRPDQILTQIDLLSIKLASYLGAAGQSKADRGLPTAMTNNLEAYRYYSLGIEKAQGLQPDEAVAHFKKAVALDPEFAMAWARIGYTYAVTASRIPEGKPYLEKAFRFSSRLTERDRLYITTWYAIANHDYPSAIRSYREIVARYPLDVEAYARLGALLVGEQRLDEAIEVIKQGLVIDPGARELYNRLGGMYMVQGRQDESIAIFRRYVDLASDEPNAHDSLGVGFEWFGRYEEAIGEYSRALDLKPDFAIAVLHLGNALFRVGRYGEAIEQFRRCLSIAPPASELTRAWASIAIVQQKLGRTNEAQRSAMQAFKGHVKNPSAALALFGISIDRNDLVAADRYKTMYESLQLAERGARHSLRPMFYLRGTMYLKNGHPDDAIDQFAEALKHRAQIWHIETYDDCLANAYLALGRFDEAITEYRRIEGINPNYPLLHYHLAQAYSQKGMASEARESYAKFLEVWKQADTSIPETIAARKYLAA